MILKEIRKDLFTVEQGYYLVHCISGDFALGAGIAKTFNEVYNTTAAIGGALTTDEIKKGKTMLDRVYTDVDANKFIGVSATYTEDLDLLKHVKVCDDNGNEIDYKAYGLEFKFNIMPYVVKNQNATQDNTDQKMFAVINGSILTPIARNDASKKYNADAVGRTPVIQAVLCDTKNNAVADVRYFKVQWIDKAAVTRVWSPDALLNPVSYKCAGLYQQYILEKYMNDLYAGIVENGLTKSQFHDTYNKVYTSAVNNYQFFAYSYTEKLWTPDQKTITYTKEQVLELLKTGNATELEKLGIGYVQDVIDNSAATQTHNFLISLIPGGKEAQTWNSTNSITVNNPYYEGDYKFEGFFAFQSATEYVVIPVVFDIRLGATDYKYGYLASQWQGLSGNAEADRKNANKVRPINPTLISDATDGTAGGYATTQLIGDITYGYMANGVTPLNYNSLLVYYNYNDTKKETPLAIGSDLIFDESRFAEVLPSIADLNVYNPTTKELVQEAQWHTEDATKTLFYARYSKNPANNKYEILVPGSFEITPGVFVDKIYAAKISTAASAAPVAGPKYVYLVDDKGIQANVPATAGAATAAADTPYFSSKGFTASNISFSFSIPASPINKNLFPS